MANSLTKKEVDNILIDSSIKYGASDIHISPSNYIHIRMLGVMSRKFDNFGKIDNEFTKSFFEYTLEGLQKTSIDFLKEELKEKFHTGYAITVKNSRYRVNVSRAGDGYYIVLRSIKSTPPELSDLNFFPETEESLKKLSEKKAGLFLVVGPTGSGKTTTLAAILKYVNKNFNSNIISLENPVEYEHPSIKSHIIQKELGRDFISFGEGLRSALREDPDILYIGEIRDEETLELSLEAAETGHMVLATLHTDSAVEAIQRMVSMSSAPALTRNRLKSSFNGVIAQRLISFESIPPDSEDHKPVRQRVLMWELLTSNVSVLNMINEGNEKAISGLLDNTKDCNSFNKVLLKYVDEDIMPFEVAIKFSPDKDALLSASKEIMGY